MGKSRPYKFTITVTATRIDGPPADPSCYPEDLEAEINGMQIEVQDPDKDDVTLVEIAVTDISEIG